MSYRMSDMKWNELLRSQCPKCTEGALLLRGKGYECEFKDTPAACDFFITRERAIELVRKMRADGTKAPV